MLINNIILSGDFEHLKELQFHTARLVASLYHYMKDVKYIPDQFVDVYDKNNLHARYDSDTAIDKKLPNHLVESIIEVFHRAGKQARFMKARALAPHCPAQGGAYLDFPLSQYEAEDNILRFDDKEYELGDDLEKSTKPHKLWICQSGGQFAVLKRQDILTNGGFETFPLRLHKVEDERRPVCEMTIAEATFYKKLKEACLEKLASGQEPNLEKAFSTYDTEKHSLTGVRIHEIPLTEEFKEVVRYDVNGWKYKVKRGK